MATHVTDNELAQRLAAAFAVAGSASAHPWLWRCLLQLLARGEPVTEDELAAATRRPAAEVRAALAALPDTEYDDADRIVGSGITFRPTPHRFEVNGRQLYTWCALDNLIFPAILDRPARVTSPCRATGAPIHLEISPAGITAVDPEETVVSLVMPSDGCSIRTGFCDHVHFFASFNVAGPWLIEHPDAAARPVADASGIALALADALLDRHQPGNGV